MKKILAVMLALVMVASMAACSSGEGAAEAKPVEPQEWILGSEPVTITFWNCASDKDAELMEKYVTKFNETNEYQITVNSIFQGQYSDATTAMKAIISAENYDQLPDVMQLDATGKVAYYNSGKAFTADDAAIAYGIDTTPYVEGALGNWQFAGKQLGMPFATSTTITYYNMDLLKAAGWDRVPDTFADVIQLAADMKAAGLEAIAYQDIPNTPSLANWLGQMGSYVVNNSNGADDTATELDCIENGALAVFLTEWKKMYDEGGLVNAGSSRDAFVAGNVAIMTNSSSNINKNLTMINGAFEMGVGPFLRVNEEASYGATVSGSCLVMFDSGEELRKQASTVFVQYLAGAEVQADYAANTGYIPGNKEAMESDAYQALLAEQPLYGVGFEQLSKTPAFMRSVTVGPSVDFYYGIMEGSSAMLSDGLTVEETVENMQNTLQGLLDEYIANNS